MNTSVLIFQNTSFDIIDRNNQPWLRGLQIANALGYADEGKAISKLFERNSDEFTDTMTALIKVQDLNPQNDGAGQIREVRVFSLRGCHLLGMLSRAKIAKEFRKWVLDILDHQTKPQYGLKELPRPKTSGITLNFDSDEPQKILVSVGPMGTTITKLLPDEEIIKKGQYYIMARKDEVSISKLVYDFIPARFLPIMIEVAGQRLGSLQ